MTTWRDVVKKHSKPGQSLKDAMKSASKEWKEMKRNGTASVGVSVKSTRKSKSSCEKKCVETCGTKSKKRRRRRKGMKGGDPEEVQPEGQPSEVNGGDETKESGHSGGKRRRKSRGSRKSKGRKSRGSRKTRRRTRSRGSGKKRK